MGKIGICYNCRYEGIMYGVIHKDVGIVDVCRECFNRIKQNSSVKGRIK